MGSTDMQGEDIFIFAEEPESSDAHEAGSDLRRWKVLVVDDDDMVQVLTQMVLGDLQFEGRRIQLLVAKSGDEACEVLAANPDIAVMLLDVVMETEDAGFRVVHHARRVLGYDQLRIIIRTGQPGFAPESQVILEYDINDYREKTDLSVQKLSTSLIGALRSYRDIRNLKASELALKQALNDAEEASRVKSRFLANMSHEIRTPLNGIALTAQLLQTTDLTEEQQEYLDMLRESTDRLMPIINDILDLSRIEAGKLKLERNRFNVRELMDRLVSVLAPMVGEKDIQLFWDCGDSVPLNLIGDDNRLWQILSNLASNAIKYTAKGYVRIDCDLTGERDHRAIVRFSVRDTGPGILEHEQEALFKPFIQGEQGGHRGGAGLGLAISKELVERMGGSLTLISKINVGSSFIFSLPLEQLHGAE